MTAKMPNFLFIGPDKTGSTWLYNILLEHDESYVPACKDIYFFDRYYHRGMKWYLSFFEDAPEDATAVGELSHDYLFSETTARRIAGDLEGVKLLTSLRNPAERTFSHYLYMMRSGYTRDPFEVALKKIPHMIENSMYHKHLSAYFKHFDRSRIKVLLYDDLKVSPREYARQVFRFLDMRFVEGLNYDTRVLPASKPRSYLAARLMKIGANACRDLGLADTVGRVKRSSLAGLLYKPYGNGEKPRMNPETGAYLNGVFEPDIRRLEETLDKDLSHWLM